MADGAERRLGKEKLVFLAEKGDPSLRGDAGAGASDAPDGATARGVRCLKHLLHICAGNKEAVARSGAG